MGYGNKQAVWDPLMLVKIPYRNLSHLLTGGKMIQKKSHCKNSSKKMKKESSMIQAGAQMMMTNKR